MEISILLASKILSMLLACLIGYIVVKIKVLPYEGADVISKLLLFVCTPCALVNAYQIDFSKDKAMGLLIALVLSALVHILFISVTKVLGKVFKLSTIEKVAMIYTNAGYLIIPIVTAVLGAEYVFYTCAYCGLQMVLYWTHCVSLLNGKTTINFKKIISNPCLIAILVGIIMFCTGLRFPSIIQSTITDFSALLGPLCMFIIGMLVAKKDLKTMVLNKKIYMVCFFRLIVLPVLVVLMFKLISVFFVHDELHIIMLIVLWSSSSQIGTIVVQMAQLFDEDYTYASELNLFSAGLCLFSMPIITLLFEAFV